MFYFIPKGTRFGPFKGKVINTSEIKSFDDNTYMWEVRTIFQSYILGPFRYAEMNLECITQPSCSKNEQDG